MAVSKKNKACLPARPARRIIMPTYSHKKAKLRDQGGPKRKNKTSRSNPAGERSRAPIADSIETAARGLAQLTWCHCAASMHARIPIALLASGSCFSPRERARAEEDDELRRREMRRSLLVGTGEGGGMPCGWPEWNCSPLL